MEKDLHKRLEKAAENFSDEFPNAAALKIGFLGGAEYGYKEAIEVAKEWLKSSFFQCLGEDDNIHWDSSYDDITEALEFFEADVNKLWEEKK